MFIQKVNLLILSPNLSTQDRLSVLKAAEPLLSKGALLHENNHLRIPESKLFISDTIISSLFKE